MKLSISSMSEFGLGQYPFVNGIVTNSDGKPLPNVQIQANFPSSVGITTTDSAGEFSIMSNIPAYLGEHIITVFATNDSLHLKGQVKYQVIESPEILDKSKNPEGENSKTSSYDNSKYDLHLRVISEDTERQKTESVKKEIYERAQIIPEHMIQTPSQLEDQLKSLEAKNESHSPRNAFLRFLADIDYSVKNIFWHQFLFTEKRTDDAREAKEYALEKGKSSVDATKIFQQEAAVTQNELIEYNEELNIKYGNTTSNIQEQFNENDKILKEK
ncbi:MAG: carboxypeptidase-like regulatory domain-containing protein [Nitrosopumilus sp.]|nr:carboxypeptidase-like regulatory domain-containing protein [Nitrosopumilus sp.]MDH5658282.1 carboxypeptidase-like regulatory domain-containing protein [Nitrosopumilus sp.]